MDVMDVDVIDVGMVVTQTKGDLGCLVEALDCSPFSGPPWFDDIKSDRLN
jgi:hypothetical protein